MVKCKNCGIEVDDSFELCPNCGNNLILDNETSLKTAINGVCNQCGFKLTEEDDFCPNCGNKLNSIQIYKCDICGSQINENDLICSICGAKINHPKLCSNCGAPLKDATDYCPKCSQNVYLGDEIISIIEKNLEEIFKEISSILDSIILFFKQLFGGNS